MRKMLGFAPLFVLLVGSACGNDLDGETLIGATCESADDCGVTGICVVGEEGLCSRECRNPGTAQECPLGSYCHRERVETTDMTLSEMTLCFPACKGDADCRTGYKCKGVSSGSGKVCVPESD